MTDLEKELQELKLRVENLERLVLHTSKPQTVYQAAAPTKKPENKKKPFWDNPDLETLIGGTLLNRIGVIAFIIGMGFFLKYAFDNDWIGPTGRIVIGLLIGMGFLAAGEWAQKKKYQIFGQGLSGGGIAILYFSIFAAFNFYRLLSQIPAFGIMILITVAAVILALRYNALAIALLGISGGFLTPFMLNTGQSNEWALFSYIAILDLGILALAYFKNWRAINIISYFFTQMVIMLWFSYDFQQNEIWLRQFIITIFFIIFACIAFLHNIIHKRQTEPDDLLLIVLNAGVYFLISYLNLLNEYRWLLGYYAAIMGLLYFGLGWLTLQVNKGDKLLVMSFLGVALTFITIAIPIQLKGNWITIAWSMEGLALLYTGFNLKNLKIRQAAWIILSFVTLRLLFFEHDYLSYELQKAYLPVLNLRGLTFLFGIAAIWGSAYLYVKNKDQGTFREAKLVSIFAVLGNIVLLFFLSTENAFYYQSLGWLPQNHSAYWLNDAEQLTLSGIWGIYSIILIVIGMIRRFFPFRIFAMILFGVTIIKVFLYDLSELDIGFRIISLIGLGVILILVSYLYQHNRRDSGQQIPDDGEENSK